MGNFTNTCQDIRNLTCRPRDKLTFRRVRETVPPADAFIISCSVCSWVFISHICKGHKQVLVFIEKEKSFQAYT